MFHYFAYGSVLSLAHAREWCQSHALDVTPFLQGEAAWIDGYRLVFDVPSRFWQGLVADLVEEPGSRVSGSLFTLDDSTREAVLRKEGVATGLYREKKEAIHTASGTVVEGSLFLAVPERRVAIGPASARYLEALLQGARDRGLPADWARQLQAMPRDDGKPPPPGIGLGVRK
jgi:cation transport regulator ChaC